MVGPAEAGPYNGGIMHRSAVLAIALLVIAASVEAKGPTVKLTLTGPGLARAIEITEAGHWHRPSLAWATAIAKYVP
jgi:hypothetical protein